jgi:hypothetical protein
MYGERRRSAAVFVCALLGSISLSATAMAFELKHTTQGLPVRWTETSVAYVIDPSVAAEVPGGADAVAVAVGAWSGQGGAPALSTRAGWSAGKIAVDGQNTVLFAPPDFAAVGGALAVTVLSYQESTGAIVDADIVINGKHAFAVLGASARAPKNMPPVSTDGSSSDGDDGSGAPRFDFQHVVAHEAGHSLGLADVHDQSGPLMYAYTMPDDASVRAPSPDDVDGIEQAYGGSTERSGGCGTASVAGARARPWDAWVALAVLFLVSTVLRQSRRRGVPVAAAVRATPHRRAARALVPFGIALAVLGGQSLPARSAPGLVPVGADALGTVLAAQTRDVGGIFQTTLDVAPSACRSGSCPEVLHVRAWGGTIGGITQQVGELPVPRVGDRVTVALSDRSRAAGAAAQDAVLLAPQP